MEVLAEIQTDVSVHQLLVLTTQRLEWPAPWAARSTAQVGSVIGASFAVRLLSHVTDVPE